MSITQNQLKSVLHYEPTTGIFTWLVSKSGNKGIGSVAGYTSKRGYMTTTIDRIPYRLHRLAWLYMYGKFPEYDIDHINHTKNDNRLSNLREVTHHVNSKNRPGDKRNKSGHCGVRFKDNRYEATIAVNKEFIYLGTYKTLEEATDARKAAEEEYGFHPNHGESA